jgi:CBS domain-containing protein
VSRVRDAMIPEPLTLDVSASAQEAGQHLVEPDVRAVYVIEAGRLAGAPPPKPLGAGFGGPAPDPRETRLGEIVEPPNWTLDPDVPLDEAFAQLEEWDAERVPVVEDGLLVGVLSRAVLQRRLAEDEPPAELDREGTV